jgi:hypothetical protein
VTGGKPGLAVAERGVGCGSLRRGAAGGFMVAVDDGPDLLATDADIRERSVIERHQLAVRALPLPPSRDRGTRRNKEIDKRHG